MTQLSDFIVKKRHSREIAVFVLIFALVLGTSIFSVQHVHAAALTTISDTMSRLKVSTASDHNIKFTTPGGAGGAGDTITVTFPAGFNHTGVDYTDIDLTHGASTGAETSETLAATADATSWGAAINSQVLTLTHPTDASAGDIAASDKVIIKIGKNATGDVANAQIVNPGSDDTYVLDIGGSGGFVDTGRIAVVILTDDQVVVNASVDPTLTFSLTANATNFGVLSPGIVDTADTNITLQVGTNASSGYTINVKDAGNDTNPGLFSTVSNSLIGSADGSYASTGDLDSVPSGYGIQASCTAGCTTDTGITAKYRQGGNIVGGLTIADAALATYSSSLTTDHTIEIVHKAKIASTTVAGIYADTITYIATGNF